MLKFVFGVIAVAVLLIITAAIVCYRLAERITEEIEHINGEGNKKRGEF